MAASTSADSSNDSRFDVYINHRGPDVKHTLASHLYRSLIGKGLRVFLDSKVLEQGKNIADQIEGAIRSASVHIAIFSPRFAESVWCLKELVFMLESGAPIIPIFYSVKPSELRWTQGNGIYAQSLEQLAGRTDSSGQPRYDSTTIETWRNALHKVADISGFDLETSSGDEGELVDVVVRDVLRRVKPEAWRHEKPKDFEDKVFLENHQRAKLPLESAEVDASTSADFNNDYRCDVTVWM